MMSFGYGVAGLSILLLGALVLAGIGVAVVICLMAAFGRMREGESVGCVVVIAVVLGLVVVLAICGGAAVFWLRAVPRPAPRPVPAPMVPGDDSTHEIPDAPPPSEAPAPDADLP